MNRIILIGNGFDLAHGLHTRYKDFINWYWERWLFRLKLSDKRKESDGLCTLTLRTSDDNWHSFLEKHVEAINSLRGIDIYDWIVGNRGTIGIFFPCHLLAYIIEGIKDKKWVDIENEYYQLLKQSIAGFTPGVDPKMVNSQLYQIQSLLIDYLISLDINSNVQIINDIIELIYEPINRNDISISGLPSFDDHCIAWACKDDGEWRELIRNYEINDRLLSIQLFKEKHVGRNLNGMVEVNNLDEFPKPFIRPNRVLFLSFNYTQTSKMYSKEFIVDINYIHGELSIPKNIIFGYGDEFDDEFKKILNDGNNEYLRNIKSVKYLETNNYRNMLEFIESEPYQIYIMGHSCGTSDRTLLNTLFEHKNCVSIKPFYYQKEDGTDNYSDIVQNIYRYFTDMKLMRDRVVSKTYCKKLPQCISK